MERVEVGIWKKVKINFINWYYPEFKYNYKFYITIKIQIFISIIFVIFIL